MVSAKTTSQASPWRRIFEDVRRVAGNQRDADGVLGSINWLRKQMEVRGANPNVVRNIIYRDKGKINDKRVLFEILSQVWEESGQPPLQAPELEVLLSAGTHAEQEVMQLLGREKRRAYQIFVSGTRSAQQPKMLVIGRPGSGKTLLLDYIQQALESPPRAAERIVRLEFSSTDLGASLAKLAAAVDVSADAFESRLVKIGMSGAYAVQADAQADVARVILDALRAGEADGSRVMLLHISQSLGAQDELGGAPLRLNTPDVPRVSATEWLWLSLLEPLSRMPDMCMVVSMTDVPARVLGALGPFEGPFKLSPPTISEARRFVKARLPHLPQGQQEALVQRAGRSFEELRTLTLLAEVREPLPAEGDSRERDPHVEQLSALVQGSGDRRLKEFLSALAVLSIPEFPTFEQSALAALRASAHREPSNLELAFLDAAPGERGLWRCFSRQLARSLRNQLQLADLERHRRLNGVAAEHYRERAFEAPRSEAAIRYLYHLFEAREWDALVEWLGRYSMQQSLLRRLWQAASEELSTGPIFVRIAKQVAAHYVKLGSYDHPDAESALQVLAHSDDPELQAWTALKRAEGAVARGRFQSAQALLEGCPEVESVVLKAERALVEASIARWRSELDVAADLVESGARPYLTSVPAASAGGRLVHAKVAVWAGLIHKDRGDLERALREFESVRTDDDLIRARIAFQRGDVQMKLGRFDAALGALTDAVMLSHRSEAPAHEQARYLARRGTLHRKRGELQRSDEDFAAARVVLGNAASAGDADERDAAFERAKIDDEYALNLLARGQFEQATFVLQSDLASFRAYETDRRVDATFRTLRNSLRLALAYWCRGVSQPYRLPFGPLRRDAAHPDVLHAQALMRRVRDTMDEHPDGGRRYGPLYWRSLLAFSLVSGDAGEAAHAANAALAEARTPYAQAVSYVHLVAILVDAERHADALTALERAHAALARSRADATPDESGDNGLLAWATTLELRALVQRGDAPGVARRLGEALETPALERYGEALLRAFGEEIERRADASWLEHREIRMTLRLETPLETSTVRLPDALVAHWQRQRPPIVPAA